MYNDSLTQQAQSKYRAKELLKLSATVGVITLTSDIISKKINKTLDNTQLNTIIFSGLALYSTTMLFSYLGSDVIKPLWNKLTNHSTNNMPFKLK
jgi:hypothetical protein